jgi:hypothetical protein
LVRGTRELEYGDRNPEVAETERSIRLNRKEGRPTWRTEVSLMM